jgi:hypothetical protein
MRWLSLQVSVTLSPFPVDFSVMLHTPDNLFNMLNNIGADHLRSELWAPVPAVSIWKVFDRATQKYGSVTNVLLM